MFIKYFSGIILDALEKIMFDALIKPNRLEFVELLLDNGVDMQHFLTASKLEQLYNAVSYLL